MLSYQLTIVDRLTPSVNALAESMTAARLNPLVGRAAVIIFRRHFRELETQPNKNNWPKTHFWAQAAKSTSYTVQPDGATVNVNQIGVRQRYEGGDIRPVNAKMLTIPACAEAYGKRAGEFNNLRFAVLGGKPALVEAEASEIKKTKKGYKHTASRTGTHVIYWLARSVHQDPNVNVLPTPADIRAEITAALESYVARASARSGTPPTTETH